MRIPTRRRGVALITALFVVMLVTTLVTLTVSDARRSLEVTQYASFRTQAYFQARSGVERGLKGLNENASWETTYSNEAVALKSEGTDGITTWTWCEPGPDSEHLYLRARARVNQCEALACELITRRHPVDGISIVLWEPSGLDTIYTKKNSASSWDPLGPPPKTYWNKDANGQWLVPVTSTYADGKPEYVANLRNTVGDAYGNLFATWARDNNPDMVYRLDGQTRKWSLLPGVPKTVWNGAQFEDTGDLVGSLEHLACNGEKLLYALNEQDGLDAITVMDVSSSTPAWKNLPPAPKRYFDGGSQQWVEPAGKYAKSFAEISVDKGGHVYGKLGIDGEPDSIYRFVPNDAQNPEQGTWQNLPPIPQGQWHLGPDGEAIWEDEHKFVGGAKQLTVSSDGRLVVRQSRDGVDTLYTFTPGEGSGPDFVQKGSWEPIKPAPRVYYDGNLQRQVAPGFAGDFKRHATDHQGRLLTSWERDGYDTYFQYDFETRTWTDQPPIPRVRHDVDANHDLVTLPPDGYIGGIKSLGGGGLTDTGRWEYRSAGQF